MKMVMGICMALLTAVTLEAQNTSRAEITFSATDIDINAFDGKPGENSARYIVHCSNTGNVPVLFTRCQCPCGCYVIGNYPKELLYPGDTGSISLHYYRRGGMNDKYTYLHTNIPDSAGETGFRCYAFRVRGEIKE